MNVADAQQETKQARLWLRSLANASRMWVMLSVVVGLISGLLLILEMYCLAHVAYAAYIQHALRATLTPYFFTMLFLVCVRAGLAYIKEQLGFQASASVRQNLRMRLLSHINQVGPVVAGRLSTAAIVSSAVEQVDSLHEFFADYLPQMSLAVLMPAAILVFVFPLSYVCGAILLICAPLIPLFMALVGIGASSLQQKHFQTLARMGSQFLDLIQGLVSLKLMGKSRMQTREIFIASDLYRIKIMQVLKVAFLSSAVLELFAAASIALVAVYLGLGFINKGMHSHLWHVNLNLQSALFILLLAPEFFLPLRRLGAHYHAKQKAVGAAIEIAKIFSLKAEEKSIEKQMPWQLPEKVTLSFQQVGLRYQTNQQQALQDINLDIKAGEKLAVLGLSGAGKTSLLSCLLRFVEPSVGCIAVNDRDLQSIAKDDWLAAIAWLGQNPMLFRGSVRDNLLLAKPDATDNELRNASGQAKLSINLDHAIGDQNAGVSGGQAQRLALARVYLKDAPLMLLDEPTASLDAEHEKHVWSSLTSCWQEKTVVLLTHRLNYLEKMDRIVVLDEGRVIREFTSSEWRLFEKNKVETLYEGVMT
jgi:ATP-binding cassette, subfamily C, bacterial CydD